MCPILILDMMNQRSARWMPYGHGIHRAFRVVSLIELVVIMHHGVISRTSYHFNFQQAVIWWHRSVYITKFLSYVCFVSTDSCIKMWAMDVHIQTHVSHMAAGYYRGGIVLRIWERYMHFSTIPMFISYFTLHQQCKMWTEHRHVCIRGCNIFRWFTPERCSILCIWCHSHWNAIDCIGEASLRYTLALRQMKCHCHPISNNNILHFHLRNEQVWLMFYDFVTSFVLDEIKINKRVRKYLRNNIHLYNGLYLHDIRPGCYGYHARYRPKNAR